MAIFEGSAVALVLPMNEDGSIDYDGFRRQVKYKNRCRWKQNI